MATTTELYNELLQELQSTQDPSEKAELSEMIQDLEQLATIENQAKPVPQTIAQAPDPEPGEGVDWDDPAYTRQFVDEMVDSATFGLVPDLLPNVTRVVSRAGEAVGLGGFDNPWSEAQREADVQRAPLPMEAQIGAAIPGALIGGPAALGKGLAMVGGKIASKAAPAIAKAAPRLAGATERAAGAVAARPLSLGLPVAAGRGAAGAAVGAGAEEGIRAAGRGESLPEILQSVGTAATDPSTIALGSGLGAAGAGARALRQSVPEIGQVRGPGREVLQTPAAATARSMPGQAGVTAGVRQLAPEIPAELAARQQSIPNVLEGGAQSAEQLGDIASARQSLGIGREAGAEMAPRDLDLLTKRIVSQSGQGGPAGLASQDAALQAARQSFPAIEQAYQLQPSLRAEKALSYQVPTSARDIRTNLRAIGGTAERIGSGLGEVSPVKAGSVMQAVKDAVVAGNERAAEEERRRRKAAGRI